MAVEKTILSIIIPTFQAGNTLAASLESIVRQRFHGYEVLVMDGGSTDDTKAIAERYSHEHPNVHFYSERDRGIYDAMNKGIDKSSGDWIYFLGSDDVLFDETVLERIFDNLENIKQDVLYGQVLLSESNTLYLGEFDAEKLVFRNISHQALFVRRTVFEKIGKFDLRYKICADHIHNVKWFFDDQVKKKYVNIVVARFSQQGISSQRDDVDKVRDLPGLVMQHAGSWKYFKFYRIRPLVNWFKKKKDLCKKLFLRFVPTTILRMPRR
ncbi:Glycosyl transferase family 2 [Chryseolinea serpens]|uniref:Glycosyl transferase family 2 n=1 Tax=Chryseolinea serpens TaxID=947013 RepID=A0A1M5KXY5_9BACT|nr:glycosyltransferase family 2 protein [Chryseolinea serpens]SHG57668.1 Glycosyl transferase family 2 [Chryseolinea serpens]